MKLTILEGTLLICFFVGVMIPVVSGIVYFIKENNRLEKSQHLKK
ncbi:MAG TPA: hypothetical protein VGD31_16450 [Sphingobacteriaceae bacterium]